MSWAALLAAAEAIRSDTDLADLPIEGVGWATVDAERAFRELDGVLGPATWVPDVRDAPLGASVWRCDPSPSDDVSLFVLEPDTEGRLAAFLARFGEGVGAVYVAGGGDGSRVVAVNPRWGPYAIVRSRSG